MIANTGAGGDSDAEGGAQQQGGAGGDAATEPCWPRPKPRRPLAQRTEKSHRITDVSLKNYLANGQSFFPNSRNNFMNSEDYA